MTWTPRPALWATRPSGTASSRRPRLPTSRTVTHPKPLPHESSSSSLTPSASFRPRPARGPPPRKTGSLRSGLSTTGALSVTPRTSGRCARSGRPAAPSSIWRPVPASSSRLRQLRPATGIRAGRRRSSSQSRPRVVPLLQGPWVHERLDAPRDPQLAGQLTANGFKRAGYVFASWNTGIRGKGKRYAAGASYGFAAKQRCTPSGLALGRRPG